MSALELAELIRRRQPCVVLTGAGVSTESGIPDFRSRTGLWARFDPLEYASLEAFRRDPRKVWSFYKPRIAVLTEAEPNPAHRALAELERLGLVEAIVTQNIDLLHERAGSRNVVEVHGSIRTATCPACGERLPLERVTELLEGADAPACPACGEILKPDVVFFGELLPADAIDRATELARTARLLLVVVARGMGRPCVSGASSVSIDLPNRRLRIGTRELAEGDLLTIDGAAGEVLPQVAAALAGY